MPKDDRKSIDLDSNKQNKKMVSKFRVPSKAQRTQNAILWTPFFTPLACLDMTPP